jgi:hypothetical protein
MHSVWPLKVVSRYFLDPKRHVIYEHWSRQCLSRNIAASCKEQKFKAVYGVAALEAACICCGENKISYVAGRQCCMAHIVPLSSGGPTQAWNLLPTCLGCNSRYSINLLDYMGLSEHLRSSRLKKLCLILFRIHYPSANERRRLVKKHRSLGKALVVFIHNKYAPEFLEHYAHCLL